MIITKKAMSRRMLLRGMGTAIALPFLDAMVPALSAMTQTATRPVSRLGFVYIPMGSNIRQWTPAATGRITELSPSLASLTPFMNQVTVLTNLENKNAYSPGNHATANSAFLSAAKAKLTEGGDYYLGTTVDQIAARQIGGNTALPSLELGTDLLTTIGDCDNGLRASSEQLVVVVTDDAAATRAHLRVVFERLFETVGPRRGEGGAGQESKHPRLGHRGYDTVAGKLGASDRGRVSDYLDTVREGSGEFNTQGSKARRLARGSAAADRRSRIVEEHEADVRPPALALQADITRVITFRWRGKRAREPIRRSCS
jgi:hypothetical protein